MVYHSLEIKEVLRLKDTSVNGLTDIQAQQRISEYGENKLREESRVHPAQIFFRQFNEFVVYILIFAAALSFFMKEYLDAYVIAGIIVFDAVLGFIQEYKAERAVELLRKLTTLKARVVRNGVWREIPSSELVPGDVVYMEGGDKVPADIRLIEARNLQTNEASLTGESLPCTKQISAISKDTELAERSNMLYASTIVVRGTCKGIVVETGMNTEVGKIATLVQEIKETKTPLQIKLQDLGKFLGYAIIGICAVVFAIGLIQHLQFVEILLLSISLAVAAVPEGLPTVVTICLALSVQKLVRSNSLVKRLKSIETLGDVTVICSDKTGTLTKNEMTVRKLFVNHQAIDVTGYGYNTEGEFYCDGKKINPDSFSTLLEIAITCNNSTENVGDPTEMALLYCAKKGGAERLERVDELPFDADKKFMATMHRGISYYKGAVEVILEMCQFIIIDGKVRRLLGRDSEKILKQNQTMADEALRVLAMAYEKQGNFYFVGLMGMIDPPKDNVKEAIELCRVAGIRSVMITGDHPLTAKAVAHQIGLDGRIIVGKELDELSDDALREIVKEADIYARTSSYHKVRILRALQENGEIVAMTGDGINDAPALKRADVGVAMSLKGTDVSRDVAEMILLDDNFATIVSAVKHGRIVYDNIKKFVLYLVSANTAEVGIILFSLLLGFPLLLLPIHLLWLNLMTDSWPALALGVDNAADDVMQRKPRNPKEKVLAGTLPDIIITGILGTVLVLGLFWYFDYDVGDLALARTVSLTAIIMFELFRAYSTRSKKAFANPFSNKWLNLANLASFGMQLLIMYTPLNVPFRLIPLGLNEWLILTVAASLGYFVLEIYKIFRKPSETALPALA